MSVVLKPRALARGVGSFGGYLPANKKILLCALCASVVKNMYWTRMSARINYKVGLIARRNSSGSALPLFPQFFPIFPYLTGQRVTDQAREDSKVSVMSIG